MNYESALEYIHAVQWAGHKPGLSRTRTLLAALGDPHKRLRFVHVAGTNGKGSTAAMLASCLQAAGYRVGLYTSPFINRFNERIQVNGEQRPDDALVRLVEQVRPAADAMADIPTEFEIITALGMLWFAEEKCDIVVLEVGLGGTLDSTNVIDPPECAVITALGMDHVKELGPTIADIAAAKAGIELISLVPPSATPEHVRKIAPHAKGYTYLLSRAGITGTDKAAGTPAHEVLAILRELGAAPGLLGFGVSTPEHVRKALASGAAGVIVGSAIVRIITEHVNDMAALKDSLGAYVRSMKDATR